MMEVGMITGMFQATTLPVLEQVVNFSHARHNVLAGNIANLDTPGYQARDLSVEKFQARLRAQIETLRNGGAASETHAQAAGIFQQKRAGRFAADWGTMVRHDEVDVSLEQQIAQLSKNQMQHNLAVSIMASQFRLLQAAVAERA
jgi:flagellar basal-body rod protein FlgB